MNADTNFLDNAELCGHCYLPRRRRVVVVLVTPMVILAFALLYDGSPKLGVFFGLFTLGLLWQTVDLRAFIFPRRRELERVWLLFFGLVAIWRSKIQVYDTDSIEIRTKRFMGTSEPSYGQRPLGYIHSVYLLRSNGRKALLNDCLEKTELPSSTAQEFALKAATLLKIECLGYGSQNRGDNRDATHRFNCS
jgi:hypothetical protein